MKTKLSKITVALATVGVLAVPMSAMASNGLLAYGNGMIAHGVGGAGVANASEVLSALDNPALLSRTGGGYGVGTTLFFPNASANVGRGYVDSEADQFIVPQGGWYKAINDDWVAGISVSALGGIAAEYSAKLVGAPLSVDLAGVIIAPAVSYQVNDAVSVGAALNIGVVTFETEGPGVNGLPRNDEDDTTGIGFEIGAAFNAGERTVIGVDYQSEIDLDVMDAHAQYIFAQASDPKITLPALTTIGVTHQINDTWKVSADITDVPWTDIKVLEELYDWEDQTVYKIGFEKQVNDSLALRFGYNHGETPIPDEAVGENVLVPATTEDHYTVGFTKKLGHGSISGYYARIANNELSQAGTPGGFPKIKVDQDALGLSYHVEF